MMSVETLEAIETEQRPDKTLDEVLQSLVGLPFQLARLRYGDELTLQLGQLRDAKHPRLRGHRYGEVEIATRASGWKWSGSPGSGLEFNVDPDASVDDHSFEQSPPTMKGSRITDISGRCIDNHARRELHIRFEDGSTFELIHDPDFGDGESTLADWELRMPGGCWDVWPNRLPTYEAIKDKD